jgi:hypothetical protein
VTGNSRFGIPEAVEVDTREHLAANLRNRTFQGTRPADIDDFERNIYMVASLPKTSGVLTLTSITRICKIILKTTPIFICFALFSSLDIHARNMTDQRAIVRDDRNHRDHDGGDNRDRRDKRCDNDDRDDRDRNDRNHDSHRGRDHRRHDHDNCDCEDVSSVFAIEAPGVSLEDPMTLLTAFVFENTGKKTATDVEIRSITLGSAILTLPSSLPRHLGTVPSHHSATVDADFTGTFFPSSSQALTVSGTFMAGHERHCFRAKANIDIPAAAPGSNTLKTTRVGSNTVTGAPFPHQPLNFDQDVNTSGWTVPTGAFVPGIPTATSTSPQKAPLGDPPAIDFVINNSLGLTSGGSNGTFANSGSVEPSGGASGGGVVFVVANWAAAFSIDGGNTFTQLDPTKIFPNDAVSFCCDQIVQYIPSIDRFIWLLQGNGNRLASASPADIIASNGTA